MPDGVSFMNMDSWRGSGDKYGLSFKQIIILHINRCVQNGSVEYHGGYWNEIQKDGGFERKYVPNSREVFCNSIQILKALLSGYFDDKIKEGHKKYKESIEKINKKYNDRKNPSYQIEKVDIHLELFEILVLLAKRLNFFEEESHEETI